MFFSFYSVICNMGESKWPTLVVIIVVAVLAAVIGLLVSSYSDLHYYEVCAYILLDCCRSLYHCFAIITPWS